VVLEVEDNGVGIPSEDRRRVFEPFFRTDDRLRARSSGAGLGLAISKSLVLAHGGTIEAQPCEGQGTRMTVCLPVHPLDDPETAAS